MLKIVVSLYVLVLSVVVGGRVKRLLNGVDLPSHDLYNTQYLVALFNTHSCVSEQYLHRLDDCNNQIHCGGSLIKPDFVLTACHCLIYETFYSKTVAELPPINRYGPDDIPRYVDIKGRIKTRERRKGEELVYRNTVEVRHPLLNTMTIFAGDVDVKHHATQRRHAAAFFPHHYCGQRYMLHFSDKWENRDYELDIGLVKTCFPFNPNNDVKLAPLPKLEEAEDRLGEALRKSMTCLVAGWGMILKPRNEWTAKDNVEGYAEREPDILQHVFRFVECRFNCLIEEDFACQFCSTHHGTGLTALGYHDSGSPIVCDGLILGVSSASHYVPVKNFSSDIHVAVACVKEFLTEENLAYLRSISDEAFHWIDGNPITKGPGP